MTRKLKPQYDLLELKELLQDEKTREITGAARKTAFSLCYYDDNTIIQKILELKRADFFLSRTAFSDSTLWHDYYRLPDDDRDLDLFIKLQKGIDGRCYVTSFKEFIEEEY